MKRKAVSEIRILLFIMSLGLFLSSCSNAKVLYSWKADDLSQIRDNSVLVVARTARDDVRKAFEDEITADLIKRGIKAVPSYTRIPQLNPDEKLTEERKNEIKQMLEEAGFNGVVLTVLKDYQERTRVIGEGGYDASVNYGYRDLPTYMGSGFYVYFQHPLSYSTEDIYVPQSPDVITSKLYVVETVAFDLDQEDDKQLMAVVRASLENPSGAASTAKDYAKAIASKFK